MSRRVLVVVDEDLVRWSLVERLRADGCAVAEAGTAAEALDRAAEGADMVVLDHKLPDADGIAVLRQVRDLDPDVAVMMLTPRRGAEIAGEAMKAGAFDYTTKPFDLDDVGLRVGRALEATRLRRELRTLRDALATPCGLGSIIGESEPMRRVKSLVRKVAASPGSTVLITGESGTGKDLIAKVIHYSSRRAPHPFLRVTCSQLSEVLLESTLFGHERGAFTAARQQRPGLLEQADEGTVLLDEIDAMPPLLQARLLGFLEGKTFRRLGGTTDVRADVRVVAATNRGIEAQVREGRFRDDLYYRLNVLRVEAPPLRLREGDVPLLAQFFLEGFAKTFRRPVRGLGASAETALGAYRWPGNVRELRVLIERAVLLSEADLLQRSDFESLSSGRVHAFAGAGFNLPAAGVSLADVERSLVAQALDRAGGNQTRAAALLGLHRDQIRYRMEKFGLAKKT